MDSSGEKKEPRKKREKGGTDVETSGGWGAGQSSVKPP